MPVDTTNKKLAIMEWDNVWEPALPLSPGTFGQDDKQQLLWGYPGILWTEAVAAEAVFILGGEVFSQELTGLVSSQKLTGTISSQELTGTVKS